MTGGFRSLARLLAFRYRLLWAHARSGQGRLVLIAVGVLALALVLVLAGLGGLGAAAAAIHAGRSELVAAVVLVGLFFNAAFAAIFLGVGVHRTFDDVSLRRYPVSRGVRLAARHLIALLEPLWLIVFALVVGLSVGFSGLALPAVAISLPAAILFVVVTYLTARTIAAIGEWLLSVPGGAVIVTGIGVTMMMLLPAAPALVAREPSALALFAAAPPLVAARMLTSSGSPATMAALTLIAWCAGLWVVLRFAERLPRRRQSVSGGAIAWRHPVDRIAAIFGPRLCPLAGKHLRYYVRSPQLRYNYPLMVPVLALIASNAPGGADDSRFLYALGALPAAAFLATGTLSMNLFGFDGHGFRRYFLLPVRAADVLRTATLVSLLPATLLVPIAVAAWAMFAPQSASARMIAMLLCAGFGGLLFFQALATWTALLAPRAIPFDTTFGNKLSPAANALFVAAMAAMFGVPMLLMAVGLDGVLAFWWLAPGFLAAAASLFLVTLKAGAGILIRRREEMLAVIEG